MPPAAKITGAGATSGYLGQKGNVKNIFNTWAETDASELDGTTWDQLPEATLCSKDVYERFAYFMLHVHLNGTHASGLPKLGVDASTCGNYLGIIIHLAQDKFKANGSAEAKQFFSCLDKLSSSPEAIWLRKLKSNVTREHIDRAMISGTPLDKSASELPTPTPAIRYTPARPCHDADLRIDSDSDLENEWYRLVYRVVDKYKHRPRCLNNSDIASIAYAYGMQNLDRRDTYL